MYLVGVGGLSDAETSKIGNKWRNLNTTATRLWGGCGKLYALQKESCCGNGKSLAIPDREVEMYLEGEPSAQPSRYGDS